MCGIVGIVGEREVAPDIVAALHRLEYRGYDSAGIATVDSGALRRRRAVGKLSQLAALVTAEPIAGRIGIGHTRWATHGAPTTANAHPHQAGPVAVVHNGIIENYRALREELTAAGRNLETDTDTETIAQLCALLMQRGLDPEDAAAATLARLEGAFALCFLFEGEDDLIVAARRGSPLAIGYGDGEMFVGSDALALAPLTNRVAYLEEGDRAVIRRSGAVIHNAAGEIVDRPIRTVSVESVLIDKGEHRHFMAKEIHEQPTVIGHTVAAYVDAARQRVVSPAEALDFNSIDRLTLVACGTAYYACHVAKYWFEAIARLPVEIDIASEFRYREPPLSERDAAIFVSQSGETADTLAALRYAAGKVKSVLAVVNVAESSIARAADIVLPIRAGAEIGVASTKAFTCQLVTLATTAILAGRQRGAIDAAEEARLCDLLAEAPRRIAEALTLEDGVAALAQEIARARDVLYLGRGAMYPLALEGALKLKELSYIHAEGYASGEMKHGPIALIDDAVPVVVLAPTDPVFEKTVSNMQEVMARGGKVALITDANGAALAGADAWRVVVLPRIDRFIAPIVYAAPAQLLAYHAALAKGTDVDQPRNLAKSVTVE
ncbi:glutamine--fructose-6-phosphate transaminase (isomerizing) [Pikeienuella piscinae]|uniref:Glutamine--fructose-6-phosphate aminotransferase [isomerizing] n=1 Tax=Pikeienuella piscinae TaxID=2748098 RepID=A0A7L5BZT5_9RHOB|nr:glutamine--fructose-6-phosphate transaminase (isomerizing) [Pikeienuella piscinae]QIE55109.1 glutamine--fructose-6-phosphate transaminase (isomerizing) [Pikeienuella piscinae]